MSKPGAKENELEGKSFVQALKNHLNEHPGKVEQFARKYFRENKEKPGFIFADLNATLRMAESILELNDPLKKKDTEARFVKIKSNTSLQNSYREQFWKEKDQKSLKGFLKGAYNEIKTNPIPQKLNLEKFGEIGEDFIRTRYEAADVKKSFLGQWNMLRDNKKRDEQIDDLQKLMANVYNLKDDPNPKKMEITLKELNDKINKIDNEITQKQKSQKFNLMGESRLQKVVKDLREEIKPLIKENKEKIRGTKPNRLK